MNSRWMDDTPEVEQEVSDRRVSHNGPKFAPPARSAARASKRNRRKSNNKTPHNGIQRRSSKQWSW